MNLQQFKYFEEICRCGSITKAADNLFISQQGLSLSIRRLEKELKCPLLKRSPSGVEPTDDGIFFLERIKIILEKTKECEDYFSKSDRTALQLKAGSISGATSEFSAALISSFTKENPYIRITLQEYSEMLLDKAVENGSIDTGFGLAPFNNASFETYPVFSRPMCLIMQKSHPLATLDHIPDTAIKGLPMVLLNETYKSSQTFLSQCKDLKISPNVKIRTGDIYNLFRIVSALPDLCGLTVISVSKHMLMENLVAIPFENRIFSWDIHMIVNRSLHRSESVEKFIQYVKSTMPTTVN